MGNSWCRSGEASSTSMVSTPHNTEKESLLLHHNLPSLSSSNSNVGVYGELKIKITKKQIEELLGRAAAHGISVDQVLARLINDRNHEDHSEIHYQRSWRPVLQTIPEVN